jgi:peptide/nickel transport system permease protein
MTNPVFTGELRAGVPHAAGAALSAAGQRLRGFFRLALGTTSGRIGLPIVTIHLFVAIFGPLLAPFPPTEFHLQNSGEHQLIGPSSLYWLGTDQFGRDVLSRVLSGAGSLISIALSGAFLGIFLGTLVGMSSGYKGGKVDEVVMRVMDGMLAFPGLLLALLILSTLGAKQAPWNWLDAHWESVLIVATVGIVFTPGVARVMRSVTLKAKNLEFVMSARLRGESSVYIIFKEILPTTMTVLAVELSVRLSYSILIVSSLGFLGLGVQPPSPDWGLMIGESRQFIGSAPWMTLAPAVAVATLVVGVNLLTDGIKQASGLPREITR